jgi:hypothetical protein
MLLEGHRYEKAWRLAGSQYDGAVVRTTQRRSMASSILEHGGYCLLEWPLKIFSFRAALKM